jgi:UDP-N-acetylmuramoylalanine--D-glutamate ligase
LGGLDKGSSYKPLISPIKKKVKTVLSVGSAAAKISRQLKGASPVINVKTIKKAVGHCIENGKEGDICLLSPACASFDQFQNFQERGKSFKTAIRCK